MGRIRKKLYLSTKITESMRTMFGERELDNGGTTLVGSDAPEMNTSQLKSLVRRGAQTLSHPELDVTEMLSWDLDTMLQKCRDKPADPQHNSDAIGAEIDEEKWLSVVERVESAVFDGKRYQRNLGSKKPKEAADISNIREDRRERKQMTVMVDGYEVSRESLHCAQWEAVPTMAGKDPRLENAVREKRHEYLHEEHCLACFDGAEVGHMVECKSCPRAFHFDCLDEHYQEKIKGFAGFFCSQHTCCECGKNSTDAGGLMYRCRWCPRGFCEDCLEWGKEELIGENLPEFEMMHQPSAQSGFYIKCPDCVNTKDDDQEKSDWIKGMEEAYAEQHVEWFQEQEQEQQRVEQHRDAAQETHRMDGALPKPSFSHLQVTVARDERGYTPSLTDNSTTNDESGFITPRAQKSAQTSSKKRATETNGSIDANLRDGKRTRVAPRAWTIENDMSEDDT